MNPPLRAAADRDALIEGLLDGTVDCIATDHAPHAIHEKQVEFDRAPNGILGLETALGLTLRVLNQQHKLPLLRALALLTFRPAEVVGLGATRGHLGAGAVGGAVVFAASGIWTYRAENTASLSRNTPFDGWQFPARIVATLCHGQVFGEATANG
jgi:dihydroorotase